MENIVALLRAHGPITQELCNAAADEIERLQKLLSPSSTICGHPNCDNDGVLGECSYVESSAHQLKGDLWLEIKEVSEDFWIKVVEWDDADGDELVINCGPYEAQARLSAAQARQVVEFIQAWLSDQP